jgi:CubicO group peptidase (beta-lactamase class C family)
MKRFFFCAVGVIFLTCRAGAGEWTPELDAYIENARKAWEAPGIAVVAVRDGKIIAAKGYGVRRLGKPDPVDADTVFDIASLSKSFTASAIATLVDEGKMRWDDPVRRHLPSFELSDAYRTHHVSVRDLLAHRVGLERSDSLFVFSEYDTAEVIRRMRFVKEGAPFRGTMIYSNLGYIAAGEAAAAAAKTSFVDLLRTRLLVPLGMTATTAGVSHVTSEKHASPHSTIAGVSQPIRDRKAMNAFPANAINTTARDLAKWLIFQLGDGTWEGKRIISADAMQEMHSIQMIIATTPQFRASRNVRYFGGYALGWNVMDYRGHPMLWHSGGADGMPTYMAILPEKEIGVAVMINTWAAPGLHGALAGRILDTLLDETPKDSAGEALTALRKRPPTPEPSRTKDTKPSRELEAYAGVYEDPLYGAMTVRHEKGALSLQFARGDIADLEHWHYDTFRAKWRDRAYESLDTLVQFSLDATGKPVRVQYRMNRDTVDAVR